MSDRIARLRAALPELGAGSFLVTRPVNSATSRVSRARTPRSQSSADRLVVATDGRYVESARALEGVEVVQADRDLLAWLSGRLDELAEGPVAFEADHVTVAGHESLRGGGAELLPDDRRPGRAPRGQGRGRARRHPPSGAR